MPVTAGVPGDAFGLVGVLWAYATPMAPGIATAIVDETRNFGAFMVNISGGSETAQWLAEFAGHGEGQAGSGASEVDWRQGWA